MRRGSSRVDELVATILPKAPLPAHLRPSLLLDENVVPPMRVADKVLALRELLRSGGRDEPFLEGKVIHSSSDIAEHFIPLLGSVPMESIWIVGLDVRNRVRVVSCIGRGGISACAIQVADVLRPLVLNATPCGVVVHNHPSGDPHPSRQDIELTSALTEGATLLGLRIVDHVVVAANDHFSFADAGFIARR